MVKSTSGMSPSTKTEKEMVSWDGKNYSFPKFDRLTYVELGEEQVEP